MPYIPSAHVITILYPKGTATIATALRCLTTRASSFVNAISYKTRLLTVDYTEMIKSRPSSASQFVLMNYR